MPRSPTPDVPHGYVLAEFTVYVRATIQLGTTFARTVSSDFPREMTPRYKRVNILPRIVSHHPPPGRKHLRLRHKMRTGAAVSLYYGIKGESFSIKKIYKLFINCTT